MAALTPSDLDEIRKRCEAAGSDSIEDAFRDRQALLDEVELLDEQLEKADRQAAEQERVIASMRERLQAREDAMERLQTELGHMKKYVAVNDEEYLVMKDVLRAEHKACQELREQVERLTRERDAAWRQHDFVAEREKQIIANLERADAQLSAVKAARDEACGIAKWFAERVQAQSYCDKAEQKEHRIAELRKAGE